MAKIFIIIITHNYKISYNLKLGRINQSMIVYLIIRKSYQIIITKYLVI